MFEYWFPTVIFKDIVRDAMPINQRVQAWLDSEPGEDYLVRCREDSLTTTYFKRPDIISDIGSIELTQAINHAVIKYCRHLGITDTGPWQVDSWLTVFAPGDSEQQHNHYGNFLSGVYYVSAPPETGAFRFYEPGAQKTMWHGQYTNQAPKNVNNSTNGTYYPRTGEMILFPSWMEHAVLANKSQRNRISIAFNINKDTNV